MVKEYEGEFYSFRADVIETIDWDESTKQLRLIQEWQDTSRAKGGSSEQQSFALEAMGENEWSVRNRDGNEQMTIAITNGILKRVGFAEDLRATFRGEPTPDLGSTDRMFYKRDTTDNLSSRD